MNAPKSVAWPLLFTYNGPVIGNGFLSYIELCGKLLASPETEGVWLYGVNPGAFAISARTLDEANRELRDTLTRIFIDFAESADSFDQFKTAVEQFYAESDSETLDEWQQALLALQQGTGPVPEGLPRKPADWECFVTVTEKALDELTPSDNAPVQYQPALAAAA